MDKNLVKKNSDEIVKKPEDHDIEVINPVQKTFSLSASIIPAGKYPPVGDRRT